MTISQQQQVAYELAMEYMKTHNLLSDVKDKIPDITKEFEEIYNLFYNNLTGKKIFE